VGAGAAEAEEAGTTGAEATGTAEAATADTSDTDAAETADTAESETAGAVGMMKMAEGAGAEAAGKAAATPVDMSDTDAAATAGAVESEAAGATGAMRMEGEAGTEAARTAAATGADGVRMIALAAGVNGVAKMEATGAEATTEAAETAGTTEQSKAAGTAEVEQERAVEVEGMDKWGSVDCLTSSFFLSVARIWVNGSSLSVSGSSWGFPALMTCAVRASFTFSTRTPSPCPFHHSKCEMEGLLHILAFLCCCKLCTHFMISVTAPASSPIPRRRHAPISSPSAPGSGSLTFFG
jgi:hypothetical protein